MCTSSRTIRVRIGDDAIIGAGSVVRADVPAGVVAAGNPLQVLDSTKDYVARQKELFKRRPRFGPEYRFESGLTDEMKAELREAVREGAAFID